MKRETFVTLIQALLAEAGEAELREAEGLLFWRKRELLQQRVKFFASGERIIFLTKDGQAREEATIDHLNKLSISVRVHHKTQGFTTIVVPIQRVLGEAQPFPCETCSPPSQGDGINWDPCWLHPARLRDGKWVLATSDMRMAEGGIEE